MGVRVKIEDLAEWRATAPELLDQRDAARYLGVSESVLLIAVREQGLPARLVGERVRVYSKSAIDKWVASGQDGGETAFGSS